ncbi:MAG: hypothetical protein JO247_01860 [Chloroflexi bacterium]|nr:hypothetical protein [Chloroflexota bacterium]
MNDTTRADQRRILPPVPLFAILAAVASHRNDLLVRFGNQAILAEKMHRFFGAVFEVGARAGA